MADNGTGSNIQILHVKETITALKDFEPDLYKKLNTQIRRELNVIKNITKGKYPKGEWQVQINTKRILGSIRTRPGSSNPKQRWGEADPGVRASIFEFAGSRTMGETPQAAGLIDSLTRRYGQPGRFLWSAWDEKGKTAIANIERSVKAAERELQLRLDERGEER